MLLSLRYNLGCSTPDYPTSQWIACHPQHYIISDDDKGLISGKCKNPEELPVDLRDEFGANQSSTNLSLSSLYILASILAFIMS